MRLFCVRLEGLLWISILVAAPAIAAQTASPNPPPDSRFKVDILEIVAHPDDDIEVAAYVAQLIERQHKRVAVVYTTRGNSGGNAAGPEQSRALADVREMEARHSLASYGIVDAWFLDGSDTPGGDVLRSLERWGHGKTMEDIIRVVRLTRPEVILTWLPNYDVGENHEDHQAAGVLATDAFDLAANPLTFPAQVDASRDRFYINNYGEGLRPWQPKKIYYFSDASDLEFSKGKGPEYPTQDISASRKVPYSQVAAEAWGFYQTQNDFNDAQLKEFTEKPVRLIFGKSLVGGSVTGDVFEGIEPRPIAYVRARGYQPPPPGLAVVLGGPWAFYQAFWPAHNIEHLADLYPPQAQVAPGESLWVPLLLRNDTDSTAEVRLRASLPVGWVEKPEAQVFRIAPHDTYPVQLRITSLPSDKDTWKTLTWEAESDGRKVGSVTLRVDVVGNYLSQ